MHNQQDTRSFIQKAAQEHRFLTRETKKSWERFRTAWVGIVLTTTITRLEDCITKNLLSPMETEHVNMLLIDYHAMLNLYIKSKI